LEHHGGKLRFMDSSGSIIADQIDAQNYRDVIGEAVQKSSYLIKGSVLTIDTDARLRAALRQAAQAAD